MAIELLIQEALAVAVLSPELVFMNEALTSALAEPKKAQVQLALLQQKYDRLEGDMQKGF